MDKDGNIIESDYVFILNQEDNTEDDDEDDEEEDGIFYNLR